MSPQQCRAARAWLDWTQGRLAIRARVGISTVKAFESGSRTTPANQAAMRTALEKAGVKFIDGESVGITGPKDNTQEAVTPHP